MADVVESPEKLQEKFDLIYLFNSFYSFNNQKAALQTLREEAKKGASLMLYDYVDFSYDNNRPEFDVLPHPIKLDQIELWLK